MKRFLFAGEGCVRCIECISKAFNSFRIFLNIIVRTYHHSYEITNHLKSICYSKALFIFYFLFFLSLQSVKASDNNSIITDVRRNYLFNAFYIKKINFIKQAPTNSKLKPLKIGQRIPKNLLTNNLVLNSDLNHISTTNLKKRAVIIELWATWCGSCISQFPRMDSLQSVYAEYLDVYLLNNLNRDSEDTILAFFNEYKNRFPEFNLPFIVGDANTRALIPGKELPHYIWIDANGRVKAITRGDEVTDLNIQRLIAGLSVDAKVKKR